MMDSTPEEKLLNLIRKDQPRARIGKELKIFTKINILLIGLIVMVAAIFVADVLIFKKEEPGAPLPDTQAIEPAIYPVMNETEEDRDDTINIPSRLNISSVSKEDILSNLNLLGIITGDNIQAIIEDKTLKKTYFLYKGDSIGDLKVYDIKENAVILDYNGAKIELKI